MAARKQRHTGVGLVRTTTVVGGGASSLPAASCSRQSSTFKLHPDDLRPLLGIAIDALPDETVNQIHALLPQGLLQAEAEKHKDLIGESLSSEDSEDQASIDEGDWETGVCDSWSMPSSEREAGDVDGKAFEDNHLATLKGRVAHYTTLAKDTTHPMHDHYVERLKWSKNILRTALEYKNEPVPVECPARSAIHFLTNADIDKLKTTRQLIDMCNTMKTRNPMWVQWAAHWNLPNRITQATSTRKNGVCVVDMKAFLTGKAPEDIKKASSAAAHEKSRATKKARGKGRRVGSEK